MPDSSTDHQEISWTGLGPSVYEVEFNQWFQAYVYKDSSLDEAILYVAECQFIPR